MRNQKSWALLALLVGACAIPNIEIDDSLGSSSGGSTSSDDGGMSNHAGSKNQTGKDGGAGPTTDAGADTGGTGETSQAGEPTTVGGSLGMGGKATGGSGGTRPTGGTGTGGSGTGGTGGTGVPPAGAVAKFCNEITVGGKAVDMELRIGTGANVVRINATTGTCQPVVNHDCTPIPIGSAVPVNVYDTSNSEVWAASPKIVAGDAWIFSLYFDDASQMLAFAAKHDTTAQCAATDFGDVFP